jgi:hypothetical protein
MQKFIVGLMLIAATVPAHSDAITDQLFQNAGEGCVKDVKISLGEAIRNGIEGEVKRRELALKMPASIDGLSCLDNLMDVDLDIAIRVQDLPTMFKGAVTDATNQVCNMAHEEISKLTEPLQQALQLPQLQSLDLPDADPGSGPDIDFSVRSGRIDTPGTGVRNTEGRAEANSILRELYHNYYNGRVR